MISHTVSLNTRKQCNIQTHRIGLKAAYLISIACRAKYHLQYTIKNTAWVNYIGIYTSSEALRHVMMYMLNIALIRRHIAENVIVLVVQCSVIVAQLSPQRTTRTNQHHTKGVQQSNEHLGMCMCVCDLCDSQSRQTYFLRKLLKESTLHRNMMLDILQNNKRTYT